MNNSTSSAAAPAVAYLQSQYPMLSMIFVIREVLQLRQMGFRIDVVSINNSDRPPEKLTAEERAESLGTYYVKAHGAVGAMAAHLRTALTLPWGYVRGLMLALRLSKFDLKRLAMHALYFTEALMVGVWMRQRQQEHVHAHLGSQSATVGMLVQKVFGFGFSITVHGPDEFYDAQGQYLAQKVAAADFICCISDFARSQLMKLSPYEHWGKLVVCRLGVDCAVFAPRPPRARQGPFEVLCVGRLTSAKGQHVLLDAAIRMVKDSRDVRLRFVGAGVDRDALEAHARHPALQGRVFFEGGVNQDRIRSLYAAADCFCLPSFAEGIPVVLMEAMAMEIPCVTTHVTGIPELIRDGVDGLLVAPSDVRGLAGALTRLIDDPTLCVQLGARAREKVMAQYDLQHNVRELAAIFESRITVN